MPSPAPLPVNLICPKTPGLAADSDEIIVGFIVRCACSELGFIGLALLLRSMTVMDKQLLFWYQTPVGFAFVLFALDRWRTHLVRLPLDWILDAVVLLVSISRTVTWFLPLSGHTLFLTYAILTGKSKLVRSVALVVLTEAIAIKHFWLNDDSTPWVGMIVGLLASIGALYGQRRCQ